VTQEIVRLYDQAYPVRPAQGRKAKPAAAKPAARPISRREKPAGNDTARRGSRNSKHGNGISPKIARTSDPVGAFFVLCAQGGLEFLAEGCERPLILCFCRAAGNITLIYALKRVARRSGRKPTFLLGRFGVHRGPATVRGVLCLDLTRSGSRRAGGAFGRLEIVDVEWKIRQAAGS